MDHKILERFVIAAFTVIGVVAAHQWLASQFPTRSTMAHGAGDWAAWLAAIGTIAAAVIALRIAGQQERTRRQIELAQASIVAARICKKLSLAHAHVQSFEAQLTFHDADKPRGLAKEEAKLFLSSPPLTIEHADLVALTGLGENYATQLAYAMSLLEEFKASVKHYVKHTEHINVPLQENMAKHWENTVRDIAERIALVQRACEEVAMIHAPKPTREELFGEGGEGDWG